MKVSFLGDISLNGEYQNLFQKGMRPFENVRAVLHSSDIVAGNLECMAEGETGENLLKRPRLKTRVETLAYLKDLNLSLATLAHNHVYDNLMNGFQKTISFLESSGITWMGAGVSAEIAVRPCFITRNNVTICFLNYVTADTHPNIPDNAPLQVNFFSYHRACDDICRYRSQADHIVVLLHWGGRFEGGCYPDWYQPRTARSLIDAGADLIVGGHSHTLQPFEIYKGRHIFYSLGNFCFDDVTFEGTAYRMTRKKFTESIIVTVNFTRGGYAVALTPIINTNLRISIHDHGAHILKRRNLLYQYGLRYRFFWLCYCMYFLFAAPLLRFVLLSDVPLRERCKRISRQELAAFFQKRMRRQ